jgi:PilZ domain
MATLTSDNPALQRRWRRYRFDLPVTLTVCRDHNTLNARGRSLNEGGIAVSAEVKLAAGDSVTVEFTPPYAHLPIKLSAVVRNYNGEFYGLEFVAHNSEQQEEIALLRLFVQGLTGLIPD